ncbi:MAG TPA: PAS domain S-box protein [Gaiellaceae bacterium]|nr:PAS domain S-box protein [Gaiellaceae bacterium]
MRENSEHEARALSSNRRFLGLEHEVALILAETSAVAEAYPKVLETVGSSLGWDFGAAWEERFDLSGFVRCAATWSADETRLADFAQASRNTALPPGAGLPGRVWESAAPAWITDVQSDSNFPRADAAAAAGLHAAFCFPIRTARGVVGAIEFMTSKLREPDAELLATTESLGSQIGQFVERSRAEAAMREREARHGAILESALDCIITIDHNGRVLEFNSAAEQTFGYKADEIVSREMVEMIVPPGLRDQHRAGFARYLETGDPKILGNRLEITGMRADGSEFPVELTITRIPLPGPPAFTGFVRDITERREAERELRASRVRLVGAQDAERKRLERNLHDGAQQRLVSLALTLRLARDGLPEQDGNTLELLARAQEELQLALDELRELARGIHPAVLTERGLVPALEGVADRSAVPVELNALPDRRLPESIEAVVYYVVSEALVNVAKHASASVAWVSVAEDDGEIVVEVSDDGAGGADAAQGSGIRGLADRVEALDGRLELTSQASGTTLRAAIPLR